MADRDLFKLYSGRILELASSIPHHQRLDNPMFVIRRRAPRCGSQLTLDANFADGRLVEIGLDVKACALGQAAASVISANALGQAAHRFPQLELELANMLEAEGEAPSAPFSELKVLLPAREFVNRHGSIMLLAEALSEAAEKNASLMVSSA